MSSSTNAAACRSTDADVVQGAGRAADETADSQFVVEHGASHIGGTASDRFDHNLDMWRLEHRKGIERVRVSHHEDSWTNGADVSQGGQEYTMGIEATRKVGDEKLVAYGCAMRGLGYYVELYENFTDLMQQLQSRYVMVPVAEIRYHRRGEFLDTTAALKADAHLANQVRVR